MPEERLYFDLEVEFEALTTAEEVSSDALASKVGDGLADAFFHELKLKFADQDVHVGPPQGSFRHGSLIGDVAQALSAGMGAVVTVVSVIEAPGFLQAVWEGLLKRRFGREVRFSRFRHRLRVRGAVHQHRQPEELSATLRLVRRRPWSALGGLAAVFLVVAWIAFQAAQEEAARDAAIAQSLTRIETKIDQATDASSSTQPDQLGNQMVPQTPTSDIENRAAPNAASTRAPRSTERCRRISDEQVAYLILRCH